jgi:hypothetical protein
MKKIAIFIPIFATVVGVGILAIVLKSSNFAERVESELSVNTQETAIDESERPLVLSLTASVAIPDEMEFAGERITFDRFDRRERLDRELNSFTYFHSTTMLLFKRANRIFPIIEPIMREHGLPDDFKYMAVIESSLDPFAVSPARAVGLWQFLEATGREHGLEINAYVDERYHLERSTAAAARYMRSLYRRFGSWKAASLAFNGGQGRISNELRSQRVDCALDLWLVAETTRYYYRMLAMKLVFENPQRYGFILDGSHLHTPIEFTEVTVTSTIPDLVEFAIQNGITFAHLRYFNPWLRGRRLPVAAGRSYTILIPTQESMYTRPEDIRVHDPRWVAR